MNKYIFYVLFLTIPFANISVAQHIYPVEFPLLLLVFSTMSSRRREIGTIGLLDALVIMYAVFSLVSVVAGADAIYESARHYRLMVLTPTLLYLVIRYSPQSLEVMRKGLYLMLPGILIQGILLTHDYILYGERPVGVEGAISTITASLFFAIGLGIMLFAYPGRLRGMRRIVRYAVMGALFGFLILSSTRASLVGFLIFAPLVSYVWKKQRPMKYLGRAMTGLVVVVIALIFTGTVLFSEAEMKTSRDETSEIAHSAERLFSLDLYATDLRDRMAFWGRMGKRALENPVLGSGAARGTVGKKAGGVSFNIGSAHNILVTVLATTGIIGLTIFVFMIWGAYQALGSCQRLAGTRDSIGKVILMSFSILLLVALTNDLSGGRVFIWYVLMAMASRLLMENTRSENDSEQPPAGRRIIARRKVGVRS